MTEASRGFLFQRNVLPYRVVKQVSVFRHFTSHGLEGEIESPDMTEASRGFKFQQNVLPGVPTMFRCLQE